MPENERYQTRLEGEQIDDALEQMNLRIPEGWAVGTRDGEDVPSTSQFYHNNAKYYAQLAYAYAYQGEIFIARYGRTTSTQIGQAVNNRKVPVIAITQETGSASSRYTPYLYIGTVSISGTQNFLFASLAPDDSHGMALRPTARYVACTTSGNTWSRPNPVVLAEYDFVATELQLRAPLASPHFTGVPTVPSVDPLSPYGDQIANVEWVGNKVSEAAQTLTIAINGKANKSELAEKANIDGYYEDLTVGTAEQLLSANFTEDTTPYTYRATPSYAGNRERVKKIVGASVGWNQLVKNGNFPDTTGWQTASASIGASANAMTMTTSGVGACYINLGDIINGHKYFLTATINTNSTSFTVGVYNGASSINSMLRSGDWSNAGRTVRAWVLSNDTAYTSPNLRFRNSVGAASSTTIENVMLIDLTLAFGSTIADYLYNLETGTAGAGIAKLKEWGFLSKPYYAYDAGSIQSVCADGHKMVGFNQWDEEWEVGLIDPTTGESQVWASAIRSKNFIPVLSNTTYYFNLPAPWYRVAWYDRDMHYLSGAQSANLVATAPTNACYMKFSTHGSYGATYNHDICVNISDASKNGTYEPYESHYYQFEQIDLNGIYKLDSDNNLYCDGDEYESDGTVTRRYGIVDLGTVSYNYGSDGLDRFAVPNVKNGSLNLLLGNLSYTVRDTYSGVYNNNLSCGFSGGYFYIHDSSHTHTSASYTGVYLVYELATPTTETAYPFTDPQVCYPDGTEQYIDHRSVPLPVGHETEYYKDIVAAIEGIPEAPSANGTYTLVCTVTGGVATYEWVSDGTVQTLSSAPLARTSVMVDTPIDAVEAPTEEVETPTDTEETPIEE